MSSDWNYKMHYRGKTNWHEIAGMFLAQTFPVAIAWDGWKWQKQPLTKNGHLDAQIGGCEDRSKRATSFSILMINGLCATVCKDHPAAVACAEKKRDRIRANYVRRDQMAGGGSMKMRSEAPRIARKGTPIFQCSAEDKRPPS